MLKSTLVHLRPRNRVALLLGAGASTPFGMPGTSEITRRVLSGDQVFHSSDGCYYCSDLPGSLPNTGTDGFVEVVVRFLNELTGRIADYYGEGGQGVNYEQLFYLAQQIHDSHPGVEEYDNPAIQPLIDELTSNSELLSGEEGHLRQTWQLQELAEEATRYIRDVVWRMLAQEPENLESLGFLIDACLDTDCGLDIFTLNHDRVLDLLLSKNNIQNVDGFSHQPQNGIRYWNPEIFLPKRISIQRKEKRIVKRFSLFKREVSSRVRLYKLHGSIDWFLFESDVLLTGIPEGANIWRSVSPSGREQMNVEPRPLMLVGTHNKMLEYNYRIIGFLHHLLYEVLMETRRLIVCGYSFGDKGINSRIIEWLDASADRKMIIVHPDPDNLRTQQVRPAIGWAWNRWVSQGKLAVIQKRSEEVAWKEIRSEF